MGVMLKPQPYFRRSVCVARNRPSISRLGMPSYPSGWKWCSAIQNSSNPLDSRCRAISKAQS